LVTAFTAFGDSEKRSSSQKEAGLVIEWDEASETLMCAGDTGHIRAWDMSSELHTDYQTHVSSCVSSLSADGSCAVAGFGDGTVKLFDMRRATPVALVHQHSVFVLKVSVHRPSHKLVTASARGDVSVFDLRSMRSCVGGPINNEMATAVECHPLNELIAV
jgi:WD40 repeat protein